MTAVTETTAPERRKFDISGLLQRFGTLGIFIVLVIAASIWSPSFLTKTNIFNVLRQVASSAGIMAVGMLYVILTAGIDLSVGSIAALGSVLSAYFIAFSGCNVMTSIVLVVLCGAACGLVHRRLHRVSEIALLRDVVGDDGDRARPVADHLRWSTHPPGRRAASRSPISDPALCLACRSR